MNMKSILRTLSAVFAICTIMAVSCEEPNPPVSAIEPIFPSLVQNNDVQPGSVLELSFEANMDWTVTVPADGLQWFWIKDSSFKVDKVSGKVAEGSKEKVTIYIGVSETEEFDSNRSCDVTLTMGGKSQVIAKYMRPARNRTIEVYSAKIENGAFVMNATGGYEYESLPAESVSMIWSDVDSDFRIPVKVEANFEWEVDIPEWADVQVPEHTAGSVELVFTGVSLSGDSGSIEFKAKDTLLKEIQVEVPSCAQVQIYSTVVENGDFLFDDQGTYLYTAEPVDEISLIWPGSDFRMPVMVDARCDWDIVMPEWLTIKMQGEESQSNAGRHTFIFMGNPKHYPLDETTDRISFIFDGQVIREIPVTIPGCRDRFSFSLDMSLTSLKYNPEGRLMTSTGFQDAIASGWITGTEAADVLTVEIIDTKPSGSEPEWLRVDLQTYVKGESVLQQRRIEFRPTVNSGSMRSAYVLFSNGESAEDFFEADGSLKPDMEKRAVLVEQYGADMDYVIMISSPEDMARSGVILETSDNPRLATWFGKTRHQYELTYSNPYARDNAFMSFAQPYSSYKVFNSAREDVTSDKSFWLRFTADSSERTSGVVDMYSDMTPSSSKTVGYVVFYGEDGSTLAIIMAVFDPTLVVETEVKVEFVGESANLADIVGATLMEVTADTDKELYDEFKEYVAPIYHLKYTTAGIPMRISIPTTAVKYNPNPYSKRNNFVINGLDYDETVGEFALIDGGVDVYMIPGEGSLYERGHIFFHSSDDTVVLVLVCTLDLTE